MRSRRATVSSASWTISVMRSMPRLGRWGHCVRNHSASRTPSSPAGRPPPIGQPTRQLAAGASVPGSGSECRRSPGLPAGLTHCYAETASLVTEHQPDRSALQSVPCRKIVMSARWIVNAAWQRARSRPGSRIARVASVRLCAGQHYHSLLVIPSGASDQALEPSRRRPAEYAPRIGVQVEGTSVRRTFFIARCPV
jgi:hypothetical protein